MDSVIEIDITCAKCNYKDKVRVNLIRNASSAQSEWKCPKCGAKRTTLVRRSEVEEKQDVNPVKERRFLHKDGKRYEVDEHGNPIDKDKFFAVGKKKIKQIPYSANVDKL